LNQQIKLHSIKVTFLVPNQQWLAANGVEDGEEAGLVGVAEHRLILLFVFFLNCFCHPKKTAKKDGPGPVGFGPARG
jgi:hypothetical protein